MGYKQKKASNGIQISLIRGKKTVIREAVLDENGQIIVPEKAHKDEDLIELVQTNFCPDTGQPTQEIQHLPATTEYLDRDIRNIREQIVKITDVLDNLLALREDVLRVIAEAAEE